jgi:hypothetical protein
MDQYHLGAGVISSIMRNALACNTPLSRDTTVSKNGKSDLDPNDPTSCKMSILDLADDRSYTEIRRSTVESLFVSANTAAAS